MGESLSAVPNPRMEELNGKTTSISFEHEGNKSGIYQRYRV